MDSQAIVKEQQSPDHVKTHYQSLKEYQVLKNLFYEKLQGNQAKQCRQNFASIAKNPGIHGIICAFEQGHKELWNQFMCIVGSTRPEISTEEIDDAKKTLIEFKKQWKFNAKSVICLCDNYLLDTSRAKRDIKTEICHTSYHDND